MSVYAEKWLSKIFTFPLFCRVRGSNPEPQTCKARRALLQSYSLINLCLLTNKLFVLCFFKVDYLMVLHLNYCPNKSVMVVILGVGVNMIRETETI